MENFSCTFESFFGGTFVNQKVAKRDVRTGKVSAEKVFAIKFKKPATCGVPAEVLTAVVARTREVRVAKVTVVNQSFEERGENFAVVTASKFLNLTCEIIALNAVFGDHIIDFTLTDKIFTVGRDTRNNRETPAEFYNLFAFTVLNILFGQHDHSSIGEVSFAKSNYLAFSWEPTFITFSERVANNYVSVFHFNPSAEPGPFLTIRIYCIVQPFT